jgi:hypothetical protein
VPVSVAISAREYIRTGAPRRPQASARFSDRRRRDSRCAGWIQPFCTASASTPWRRIRSKVKAALSRIRPTNCSPLSRPPCSGATAATISSGSTRDSVGIT